MSGYKKSIPKSGRVIIVHICAPHYHLFNPRLLRTFSAFRAAWRFGKIQRRPAAAAASAAAEAESGVLLWHRETMGKSIERLLEDQEIPLS